MSKVDDDGRSKKPDQPKGRRSLITLRALVLLVIAAGCGVLVGWVTSSVEAGFGVAIPLLLALHTLVD